MLSVFPELLSFGLLAPLVLRLALGVLFLRLAFRHLGLLRESTPDMQLGRSGRFISSVIFVLSFGAGVLLIVGLFTQAAALAGALVAIGLLLFRRGRSEQFAPHSGALYVLMAVVCLSLMLSGAGAIAFDLPL